MKKIGVIGGISPQATMDFEVRVHTMSQRLIPKLVNTGYPPMMVYFHRSAPVVLEPNWQPKEPNEVDPVLLDAARTLGTWADFLVITANAPHQLASVIEEAAGRPIFSMIGVTLAEARRRGWQTIGLLGLGEPRVYQIPLDEAHIAHHTIPAELRDRLNRAIFAVSSGDDGPAESAVAREAVDYLRERGVDGVILGCTEIPLLLGPDADAPDLINPLALLAEAAVKHAME